MAIIQCTECGKDLSDTALTCPSCGAKTALALSKEVAKKGRRNVILAVVGVGAAALVGRVLYVKKKEQDWIDAGGPEAMRELEKSVRELERASERLKRARQ